MTCQVLMLRSAINLGARCVLRIVALFQNHLLGKGEYRYHLPLLLGASSMHCMSLCHPLCCCKHILWFGKHKHRTPILYFNPLARFAQSRQLNCLQRPTRGFSKVLDLKGQHKGRTSRKRRCKTICHTKKDLMLSILSKERHILSLLREFHVISSIFFHFFLFF